MKLNRTPDPLDRNARNGENYNWEKIEGSIKRLDDTVSDLVLESGGDSNLEVVQARGGKPVLNDRLNSIDTQLADKANQSQVNQLESNKADKTYVDDLFENLGQLEVKGAYNSLDDLNNAYPDGTTGLFEVNGNLYAWNGNEWKSVFNLEVMPWADFMTTSGEIWEVS